jgi:hypothetical protein
MMRRLRVESFFRSSCIWFHGVAKRDILAAGLCGVLREDEDGQRAVGAGLGNFVGGAEEAAHLGSQRLDVQMECGLGFIAAGVLRHAGSRHSEHPRQPRETQDGHGAVHGPRLLVDLGGECGNFELPRRGAIDKYNARNLMRKARCILADIKSRNRVAHQDDGAVDACLLQQRMLLLHDLAGIARTGLRVAPHHFADGIDDQVGLVEVDPVGAGGGDDLLHVVADAAEAGFRERRGFAGCEQEDGDVADGLGVAHFADGVGTARTWLRMPT